MLHLRFLALLALMPLFPHLHAQAAAPPAAAKHLSCQIDRTPPAEADKLLWKEDFPAAEAAYRAMAEQSGSRPDAQLGVVRALIGQDKIVEAKDAASAFAKSQPGSALAEVALAVAAYRDGDLDGSFQHAKLALQSAPCEGRAAMVIAQLYDITGLHGRAAILIRQAHSLRPLDQDITMAWMGTLPAEEHKKQLAAFLKSSPVLSEEDTRRLATIQDFLAVHKADECHISSVADQTQTQMQPIYGDHPRPVAFGLDVTFGGKRRRMQIDTGASGIVLTDSAARGLGLEQEIQTKTGGIGDEGRRESYLSHVHTIRIGDVELQDCMVRVVAKSHMDVDGLIGTDVFSKWIVTLDYQNALLKLTALPPRPGESGSKSEEDEVPRDRYVDPSMKDWMPIVRIGHGILLPAALKINAPLHYMMMDTGAQSSSMSLSLAKEAGKLHSSSTTFTGISGKMNKVYETDDTALLVGNLRLLPESYYAFDLTNISHNMGYELGGLLGLPTLQRLSIQIDYRDNLLKLTYDPKHDRIRF